MRPAHLLITMSGTLRSDTSPAVSGCITRTVLGDYKYFTIVYRTHTPTQQSSPECEWSNRHPNVDGYTRNRWCHTHVQTSSGISIQQYSTSMPSRSKVWCG